MLIPENNKRRNALKPELSLKKYSIKLTSKKAPMIKTKPIRLPLSNWFL
jgi:hypothetical protein